MPHDYRCRYDDTHPPSASAQALGVHYRTEHADVHIVNHDRRVQCRHCGKVLATSSVGFHLHQQHGIDAVPGHRLNHGDHVTTPTGDPSVVISVRTMQTWYRCRICGREMTANNIGRHVHSTHDRPGDWRDHVDDIGQREATRRVASRVRCDVCGADVVSGNMSRHMRNVHAGHDVTTTMTTTATTAMVAAHLHHDTAQHHEPWKADDIVLPVVEQLTMPTGLLPVAQLASILVWRDATATMLAAMARAT